MKRSSVWHEKMDYLDCQNAVDGVKTIDWLDSGLMVERGGGENPAGGRRETGDGGRGTGRVVAWGEGQSTSTKGPRRCRAPQQRFELP